MDDERLPPLELVERFLETRETLHRQVSNEKPDPLGFPMAAFRVARIALANWMRSTDTVAFYHDGLVFVLLPGPPMSMENTILTIVRSDVVGLDTD